MDLVLAILICALGGVVAGLIGVGGGVLFVPALVAFLSLDQVDAEATSLLMISVVSLFGALSQRRFGNVDLRDGLLIGLLSPVGVVVGVVLANNIPERALKIAFGLLALYVAWKLFTRAFDREAQPTGSG
ncbi:MAG: TSUP family transporter [Solirubrobacterales bacterium]